ncbi:hypothetical protein Pelo_17160 [Pelomyxa schiedti]|nr:hypothetical protein Pelo_17160 [Pelomyxa schiedti]
MYNKQRGVLLFFVVGVMLTGLSLELADMDNDGLVDVVMFVDGGGSGNISWYKNPSWKKTVIVPATTSLGSMRQGTVYDVDGDGFKDVVVGASQTLYKVTYTHGTDSWSSATSIATVTATIQQVEHWDVNGDGTMDVVVGGNYLASNPAIVGGLWWFENPGFVQHTVSSPERDLRGLAVGNITVKKTGKLGDFAAGLQNSTAGPLRYFHSNCDSTSECWSPTSISALAPATEVYTVDIDGDGWLDVVQMGFSLTGAYWHKNPGHSGTWVAYPIVPITGYRFAAWADFNHDSTTDMASGAVNTVQWFSNYNGDGSGWHNFSIANVSGVKDIKAADISGDGWADVIVCGSMELVYLTNHMLLIR